MPPPPLLSGLLATSLGGALGAVARWWLQTSLPVGDGGFPWTTFAINVGGSALLAAIPLVPVVRRDALLAVFLGTGVLGGFTTMSAASVETTTLLGAGHTITGAAYCLGTLGAAVLAVRLVDRRTTPGQRAAAEAEGVDE